MRLLSKILVGVWLVLGPLTSGAWSRPGTEPVRDELRALALRAARKDAWPDLRAYAESAEDPEQRGLAYFVLGYREYVAGEYLAAAEDLRHAAESRFSLADFADHYRAASAFAANQPPQAVEALEGFSTRHPESSLRLEALELFARALLQSAQPERVIQALTAEPRVRQRPSLALLLAQAYSQAQRWEEAARAFQEVYCAFPLARESQDAADALVGLETRLGASFPSASDEALTARAETIFNNSRFAESLREYHALLQTRPASPFVGRWKVSRARCLLHRRRVHEAIEALESSVSTDAVMEAERLATLVEAHAQRHDEAAMLRVLDQLRALYPQSLSHASALSSAGSFFVRKGDWKAAARYYQLLADSFPQTDQGREASWRVAWAAYLTGESASATRTFLDHLKRYPASPHVPAVLYWLGRMAETQGASHEARALYESLQKRFVHSYYALQAGARLKELPGDLQAGEKTKNSSPRLPLAALLREVPPRNPPPVRPCAPNSARDVLRPFLTLKALSLEDLGEQYLLAVLADYPDAPDLLLALSRLKAEQRNPSAALLAAHKAVPRSAEYEFPALPEEVWNLLYPQDYRELVERQARANGLDPYLVMGLIRQESAFNPRAISRANARGLMQILPQTASPARRRRAAITRRLFDPAYNIRFGCRYLRGVLETFNGNLEQALAAYNAGDPRVASWRENGKFREPAEFLETIPLAETRAYVEAVLRDAAIYRQLLAGSPKFMKCSRR